MFIEGITPYPIRDVLLFCLSSKPQSEKAAILKTLSEEEWATLAKEAMRFDLMPYLYFQVGQGETHLMPDDVCKEFEKKRILFTSANLLVHHQLRGVLEHLAQAGIQVVLLKGAYLTHAVYKDPALRSMGDVDLLVRREQLAKTVEVLGALGYRTPHPFWIEDECAVRHHLPAFSQPGQPILEVHWSLVSPFSSIKVDLQGLWERVEPLSVAGISAYGLSPVDVLAHLCVHTCRDQFVFGLRALCDVQECLAHFGASFDWDELRHRAQQWDIERCVYLTLYLVSQAFKVKIPQNFLEALRPSDFTPQVANWALEQMFEGRLMGMPLALIQMQGKKPFGEKVASLMRGLFPTQAVIRKKYILAPSSGWVYVYYGFHVFDLLRLYGKSMLQLWRAQPVVLRPVQRVTALGEWLFP